MNLKAQRKTLIILNFIVLRVGEVIWAAPGIPATSRSTGHQSWSQEGGGGRGRRGRGGRRRRGGRGRGRGEGRGGGSSKNLTLPQHKPDKGEPNPTRIHKP